MNRRQFTATALGAFARPLPAADRIPVAFLGATHSHARAKILITKESPRWNLMGVAETDPKVRASLEKSGVPLLSRERVLTDPGIVAVAVDSGVKDHARDGKAVLEAGKHLHLEKPPADNLDELRELIALAERKKRLMQMGYMWRHHPGINKVLEAARNGWLGEVYLVRGTINTTLTPAGRQEVAMFPGGQMFELGGHLIDPLVRLLGKPQRVTSYLKHDGSASDDLKDNTVAVFEYGRALALITSATLQPNASQHRTFEVLGSNGTAVVRPIEPPTLEIDLVNDAGPYRKGRQTVPLPTYQRYVGDFEELANAITNHTSLGVTPLEDLTVQEALLAASGMITSKGGKA